MPSAAAVRSPGRSRPSADLGTWKALLARRAGSAVAALQPAALTGFWQQLQPSAERVQVEERELLTSAWGRSTSHSHASPLAWAGAGSGSSSVVFTGGSGRAFSVPVRAFLQLPEPLQVPRGASPTLGWSSVAVFSGCACNCWSPGTGWPCQPLKLHTVPRRGRETGPSFPASLPRILCP